MSSNNTAAAVVCFASSDLLRAAVDLYASTDAAMVTVTTAVYGHPIGTWCVSDLHDFSYIFRDHTTFNEPLGAWNLSQATTMRGMFQGAAAFDQAIGEWDTRHVWDFRNVFDGASDFSGRGLESWDTRSAEHMDAMFHQARRFDADVGAWSVDRVQTMSYMFYQAESFGGQGLSAWETSSLTGTRGMFEDATGLDPNTDLGEWTMSSVVDMAWMFAGVDTFDGNVVEWDVSEVQLFQYAFDGCTDFNQNVSRWNVSSAVQLQGMFRDCVNFNQDLSYWALQLHYRHPTVRAGNGNSRGGGVGVVLDTSEMFFGAKSFQQNMCAWGETTMAPAASAADAIPTTDDSLSPEWLALIAQTSSSTTTTTLVTTDTRDMFRDTNCTDPSDPDLWTPADDPHRQPRGPLCEDCRFFDILPPAAARSSPNASSNSGSNSFTARVNLATSTFLLVWTLWQHVV